MFKSIKTFFILILTVICFGFSTPNEQLITINECKKGIYFIKINTSLCCDCIMPYVAEELESTKEVGKKTESDVALNAGFFDPKTKETISYVVKNSKIIANPLNNKNLTQNPNIQKYLPKILNRSEFRILSCNNKETFDIANRNTPIDNSCTLKHSIQGGPELLPKLKLQEEAFIDYENGKLTREAAAVLHKAARTAVAINNEEIAFIIASNKNPLTLEELSYLLKKEGYKKAMAFDGGSSTSLYANLGDNKELNIISAKNDSTRKVKSVILINKKREK